MKINIDIDACIGCGLCVEICPEIFRINKEISKAELVPENINSLDYYRESIFEAKKACLGNAIYLRLD